MAVGVSPDEGQDGSEPRGIQSPMEAHASYRGTNWSPERVMFHQNLEAFADRVGLIVGLQGNGKITQEEAYAQIKRIWKSLKQSKDLLIDRGQS
ncbi:MAG: hypothetical protein ACK41W_18405 [Cyanobacteriota bacterium]|jgi:urocanate hydratase